MEPISTIMSTALGYILKGAAASKTGEKAKEELLEGLWDWVRPLFIEDIPDIENNAGEPETEKKVSDKLVQLIEEDDQFFKVLSEKVESLKKAGIREKNIVSQDIKRVKKIRIGDKVYSTDDRYDRKNIVEGNVEDADEFTLGDGH